MTIRNRVYTGYERFLYYTMLTLRSLMVVGLYGVATNVSAVENSDSYLRCLQEKLPGLEDTVTIGEIKQDCQQKAVSDEMTLAERRFESEKPAWDNKFLLQMHKPNYILLIAKNDQTNEAPFELQFPDEDTSLDDTEVKFQISAKFPLVRELFGDNMLYFAYTNRSFWQLYNDNSAPFRETNHEPEVFLAIPSDWKIFGFKISYINFGVVHQSNGRGGTLSRSWNRIFASFLFERDNWLINLKPWYRIQEDEVDDDNPDIEDYMGNFELTGLYKLGNHTFSAMLRNNLESDNNRGAVQVDWVFPFTSNLSGYIQYFNGYGESLIDYNYEQESIGIGVTLSGWL